MASTLIDAERPGRWAAESGRRLAEARRRKGLRQCDVVAELHVSGQTLSRWEHGRHDPGIYMAARMANLYGVSLDWLTQLAPHPSGLTPGLWVVDRGALQRWRSPQPENRTDVEGDRPPPMWQVPSDPVLVDERLVREIERSISR